MDREWVENIEKLLEDLHVWREELNLPDTIVKDIEIVLRWQRREEE